MVEVSNLIAQITEQDNWGLVLLISFIITWGIGLTPPCIIRYVIVREPLSKYVSIVIAGVLWFFNLVLFISLGSTSKTHAALVLVAYVSYHIMNKGYRNRSSDIIDRQQPMETDMPSDNKTEVNMHEDNSPQSIPPIPMTHEVNNVVDVSPVSNDTKSTDDNDISKPNLHDEVCDPATNPNNDLNISSTDSRGIVLGRLHSCANCERIIGKIENSYDYHDHIVCSQCYQKLISQ